MDCLQNNFILKVSNINNNNYDVYCIGTDNSIRYVKFALQSTIKINSEEIELYKNDERLEDNKTLSYYNIDKNSVLKMFFKIRSGK